MLEKWMLGVEYEMKTSSKGIEGILSLLEKMMWTVESGMVPTLSQEMATVGALLATVRVQLEDFHVKEKL